MQNNMRQSLGEEGQQPWTFESMPASLGPGDPGWTPDMLSKADQELFWAAAFSDDWDDWDDYVFEDIVPRICLDETQETWEEGQERLCEEREMEQLRIRPPGEEETQAREERHTD